MFVSLLPKATLSVGKEEKLRVVFALDKLLRLHNISAENPTKGRNGTLYRAPPFTGRYRVQEARDTNQFPWFCGCVFLVVAFWELCFCLGFF